MRSDYRTVCLDQLGVLLARGPDLLPFLQGQLSNDIALLSPQRSLLAGYHNPQGRVIAAGEPQVYRATSEEFVAQMLNLDALGAIAFDKGCYTGQEVIARAHYRGRVKRRMQRFVTVPGQQPLEPGDAGELSDGRAFRTVDGVMLTDGRYEFLAVAPLEAGETDGSPHAGLAATGRIDAETLPLPYALP